MNPIRRASLGLFAIVAVSCLGCDQLTKAYAREALASAGTLAIAADTVRLELAYNPGALLSLGSGLPAPLRSGLFDSGQRKVTCLGVSDLISTALSLRVNSTATDT